MPGTGEGGGRTEYPPVQTPLVCLLRSAKVKLGQVRSVKWGLHFPLSLVPRAMENCNSCLQLSGSHAGVKGMEPSTIPTPQCWLGAAAVPCGAPFSYTPPLMKAAGRSHGCLPNLASMIRGSRAFTTQTQPAPSPDPRQLSGGSMCWGRVGSASPPAPDCWHGRQLCGSKHGSCLQL